MQKVICNHAGGNECSDCKHNKPHDKHVHYTGLTNQVVATTAACTLKESYCTAAINGGAGDMVKCYELSEV